MEINKFRFGNIKEMLTKDQMKKIRGGVGTYKCCLNNDCTSCGSNCGYGSDDPCPGGGQKCPC